MSRHHRKFSPLWLVLLAGLVIFTSAFSAYAAVPPPVGASGLSFAYHSTFGENGRPYLADTVHLNRPHGLYRDPATGDLYVVEDGGARVLKFNAAGQYQMHIGIAGTHYQGEGVLDNPADVTLDADGNIWVAEWTHLSQFAQDGSQMQNLPADRPWEPGSEHGRFDGIRGVAFDQAEGILYAADTNNHRVEVFTIDPVTKAPVYRTTIGVTGEAGADNQHFNRPTRLAVALTPPSLPFDSTLLVIDEGNRRVQSCMIEVTAYTWACAQAEQRADRPIGVTVDANNHIYLSYEGQSGIRKCIGTLCAPFREYAFVDDLAVDGEGNVYGTRPDRASVEKFAPDGSPSGTFLGVYDVHYLTDSRHYWTPTIGLDPAGNLLVVEERGQRLLKLSPSGQPVWSFGGPGIDYRWYEPDQINRLAYPKAVTADASGKIYTGENGRIQVFSPVGVLLETWDLRMLVNDIRGLAVAGDGTIYVSDSSHHRVLIFNAQRQLIGQIGITGECGLDGGRLCWPNGLALDGSGNLYVADTYNRRVLRYNASRSLTLTLGTPGQWGDDNAHFSEPADVAVDSSGRIYVADRWNQRVQVFDAQGRYLAAILGVYGGGPFRARDTNSIEVAADGTVYISDGINSTILKYVPGPQGWTQVNVSGFGERWTNGVTALQEYNGSLYAGTAYWRDGSGMRVWHSSDGSTWQAETTPGLDGSINGVLADFVVFNNKLYATVAYGGRIGQQHTVWQYDGTAWQPVLAQPYSNTFFGFTGLAVYQGRIYVSDSVSPNVGFTLYRSASGAADTWQPVVTGGLTSTKNERINTFAEFNGALYAAVLNSETGQQIWRTTNGTDWTVVIADGFGSPDSYDPGGMAVFNGYLYAGARSTGAGGQIWRTANGTDWTPVMQNGFGNPDNEKIEGLFAYAGSLYAFTLNRATGLEVFESRDGLNWRQAAGQGFGSGQNIATLWNHAAAVFRGKLYLGTWNEAVGGQIWRLERDFKAFVPFLMRP